MNTDMHVPSKHGITTVKLKCSKMLGAYGTENNCVKYVANKLNIDVHYDPSSPVEDKLKVANYLLEHLVECDMAEASIGYVFIEVPHMFLYDNGQVELAVLIEMSHANNVYVGKGSLNNSFHNSITTPIQWFKQKGAIV